MNMRNILWGSLTVMLAVCAAPASAGLLSADEAAVTAAEQQWLKSQQTNNAALLAPLLADKVVETTDEGKVLRGKDAVIADAKTDTWTSADYPELSVMVFDHTAIAIGVFVGKGTDAAGKALDARVRFTDTWVKMADGKWLCVATHDSPIKK
jgi:uncharacterized protein (TIGR02246 family)